MPCGRTRVPCTTTANFTSPSQSARLLRPESMVYTISLVINHRLPSRCGVITPNCIEYTGISRLVLTQLSTILSNSCGS